MYGLWYLASNTLKNDIYQIKNADNCLKIWSNILLSLRERIWFYSDLKWFYTTVTFVELVGSNEL